jgi:hypothetical protein
MVTGIRKVEEEVVGSPSSSVKVTKRLPVPGVKSMDFEIEISKAADALDIDHQTGWYDGKLLLVGQTVRGTMFTRLYDAPSDELASRRTLGRAVEELMLLSVR